MVWRMPERNAMNLLIRQESMANVDAIRAVTVAAFRHAPHASYIEQFIAAALREALALSLVAEEAGTIGGHIAASPVTISDGSRNWYGLGPIAVAPTWQQ